MGECVVAKPKQHVLRYIDLFCGIGSFHYSFSKLGWKCIMACDINRNVQEVYRVNYGIQPLGDITKIDPMSVEPYDILCAGFPCQPFSTLGVRRGFSDDRGNMFGYIMKFVRFHRPPIIVLENVRGLLSHDGGRTFSIILSDLKTAGYTVTRSLLTCSDYGIPQCRLRLFMLAVRSDLELAKHVRSMMDFTRFKNDVTLSEFFGRNFSKKYTKTIRCGGYHSPYDHRLNWSAYVADGEVYWLTPEDGMRLQGYDPEKFRIEGSSQTRWSLIGNTIPTVFTKMIGDNIAKYVLLTESIDHLFSKAGDALKKVVQVRGGDEGELSLIPRKERLTMGVVYENDGFAEYIGSSGSGSDREDVPSETNKQKSRNNRFGFKPPRIATSKTNKTYHTCISAGMMYSQVRRTQSSGCERLRNVAPPFRVDPEGHLPLKELQHHMGLYRRCDSEPTTAAEETVVSLTSDRLVVRKRQSIVDENLTTSQKKNTVPIQPPKKRAKPTSDSDDGDEKSSSSSSSQSDSDE